MQLELHDKGSLGLSPLRFTSRRLLLFVTPHTYIRHCTVRCWSAACRLWYLISTRNQCRETQVRAHRLRQHDAAGPTPNRYISGCMLLGVYMLQGAALCAGRSTQCGTAVVWSSSSCLDNSADERALCVEFLFSDRYAVCACVCQDISTAMPDRRLIQHHGT
jgi:hypothetical protein